MAEDIATAEVFEGHKLQEKVTVTGSGTEISLSAIKRAEEALGELADEFDDWMEEEVTRLSEAHDEVAAAGYEGEAAENLFRVAHDLKGEADTFGYAIVTRICASLCIVLEAVEAGSPAPLDLIAVHVDSVRALCREQIKGETNKTALSMFTSLSAATDKFLAANPPPTASE